MVWTFMVLLIVAILSGGYLGYKKYNNWKMNKETEITKNTDNKIATLDTNMGIIKFRLYESAAPKTVENFISLANSGYYDEVKFHRVIQDFMIQTGDPLSKDDSNSNLWGTGGESMWGEDFADEINVWDLGLTPEAIKDLQDQGYKYDKNLSSINMVPGVVAMANRGPDTNGSQFFIVTEQPQPHLDGRHTVFGKVIVGMDIVKKIAATKTDESDRPLTPIVINKVIIEEDVPDNGEATTEEGVKINVEDGNGIINLGDVKIETEKQ